MYREYPLSSRILADLLPNDPLVVVDAGASDGGEYRRWCSLFPQIRLFGFEPDEEELASIALKAQAHAEYVTYSNTCLGRDQAGRPLYISHERFNASFLELNYDRYRRKRGMQGDQVISLCEAYALKETKYVDSISLDTYFSGINKGPADYIKVDIEGVELELLEASPKNLENAVGISIDVIFHRDWHGAPIFGEVDAFMRAHGFTLYELRGIKRNEQVAAPTEFRDLQGNRTGQVACADALYLRDHLETGRPTPSFERLLKTAVAAEVNHIYGYAFELAGLARDVAPDGQTVERLDRIVAEASRDHLDQQRDFAGHRRLAGIDDALRSFLPGSVTRAVRPIGRRLRRMIA